MNICVNDAAKTFDECSDTWLTCENLASDDCKETTAMIAGTTSVREYASMKMKYCRQKLQKYCMAKTQCEDESAVCWGPQLRNSICTYDEETW